MADEQTASVDLEDAATMACVHVFVLAYLLARDNELPPDACLSAAQLAFQGRLSLEMRTWQIQSFAPRKDLVA